MAASTLLWAWTPDPAGRTYASAWQALRDRPRDARALQRLTKGDGPDPMRAVLWSVSVEAVDLAVKTLGAGAADEAQLRLCLYRAAARCPEDDCALVVQHHTTCPSCNGRKGGRSLSPKKLGQLRRAARASGAKRKGKKRLAPVTDPESDADRSG